MLEKITDEEYYMMDFWRRNFAPIMVDNATEERFCSTKFLLQQYWNESKKKLFDLFGHELILEKEIIIEMPEQEIFKKINDLLDEYLNKKDCFLYNLSNLIEKLYVNKHIGDFEYRLFNHIFFTNHNYIYNEYMDNTPTSFPNIKEGKLITVKNKDKWFKYLRKIAKAYPEELKGFEDFRLAHSQILNTTKLTGTLCLSIHPFDFMTMSDNMIGWKSCMNWRDRECYRIGTVEMMNSPNVIIAYLKSNHDMPVCSSNCFWNNKKWRSLFVVTDELITNIKGYPYQDYNLNQTVLNWLKELGEKNWGIEYNPKCFTYYESEAIHIDDNAPLVLQFETNYMYNDFDSCSHNVYINKKYIDSEYIHTLYSGDIQCMYCGEKLCGEDLLQDNASILCCSLCEELQSCSWCGDLIQEPIHNITYIDDTPICETCLNDSTVICEDIFGNSHLVQNCYNIGIFDNRIIQSNRMNYVIKRNSKMFYIYMDDFKDMLEQNPSLKNSHLYSIITNSISIYSQKFISVDEIAESDLACLNYDKTLEELREECKMIAEKYYAY